MTLKVQHLGFIIEFTSSIVMKGGDKNKTFIMYDGWM